MLAVARIAGWAGYASAATVTGIRTSACASPGFVDMVLAYPQRSAAYSTLRLFVHLSASIPVVYISVHIVKV
jgi:hypothetical protein